MEDLTSALNRLYDVINTQAIILEANTAAIERLIASNEALAQELADARQAGR